MLPAKVLCLIAASAAAVSAHGSHGHHHAIAARSVQEDLPKIYAPVQIFEIPASTEASFTPVAAQDPVDLAKTYVAAKMQGSVEDLRVTSATTDPSTGVTHVHLISQVDGIDVINMASNINIGRDGTILSAGILPHTSADLKAPQASAFSSFFESTPADAVIAAAKALGQSTNGLRYRLSARDGVVRGLPDTLSQDGTAPASVKFVLGADGALIKVHAVQLRTDSFYGMVYTSVSDGKVIGMTNWNKDFRSYVKRADSEDAVEEDDEAEFDDEEDLTGNTSPRTSKSVPPRTHTIKTPQSLRTHTVKTPASARTHTVRKTRTKKTRTTATPTSTVFPTTTSAMTTSTTPSPTFEFPPPVTWTIPTATFTSLPVPTIRAVSFNDESVANGQQIYVNSGVTVLSPSGWFDNRQADGEMVTAGNNVITGRDGVLGKSRNGGKFDYVYDTTLNPTATAENANAAIVNNFYTANMYHDLVYKYGFTEQFANFQFDNFGKGGLGDDGIFSYVMDSEGTNNAYFASPPDGIAGEMHMFQFDRTVPGTTSDLDNTVLIHELTHGLSTRLTGGNGDSECLNTYESAGMGEGWSDTLGWWVTNKPEYTRSTQRAMGLYLLNNTVGVRKYPYSTSMTINPLLYSSIVGSTRVHFIGTVWSTILYEVFWNMVESAGYHADVFESENLAGNIRFGKAVIDGMKLQPCNPTLMAARDAILQADQISNGGKFKCEMWRGFAKRGLGVDAKPAGVDGFSLPEGC